MCRITGFGFHRVAELELDAVAPLVNTVTSCGTVHPLPASPSASKTVELRSRDERRSVRGSGTSSPGARVKPERGRQWIPTHSVAHVSHRGPYSTR